MKIQGAKKVHYDSGPNMTPLVDVVMVILIFLMLTGSFGGAAHFLFASMPLSKEGGKGEIPPTGIPDTVNLKVIVRHTSSDPTVYAYIDNQRYPIPDPTDPAQKTQEATALESALDAERAALLGTNRVKKEDIQVIIAPDDDVRQAIVIKVYEAAYASEFTKIGFSLHS